MAQAMLKQGAQAYSPDGKREWGDVPADILEDPVSIDGEVGDKNIIGAPRWSNGKRWAVLKSYLTEIPESGGEPEPEPEPDAPVDMNDVMEHRIGGILVEKFARLIEPVNDP